MPVPTVNAPRLSPGPEYAYHDPVGTEFWTRLDENFPDYQTALLDGEVVAKGCSISITNAIWSPIPNQTSGLGSKFAGLVGQIVIVYHDTRDRGYGVAQRFENQFPGRAFTTFPGERRALAALNRRAAWITMTG